jgi:hypothetical protein
MSTITFDTHDFVRKLKGVGFSEEQAEVITDLQKTTSANTLEQAKHDYELDNIATKRDLKESELQIESKIRELDTTLQLKIEQTKSELQRWMVTVVLGTAILQTAIIAALILKLTAHI